MPSKTKSWVTIHEELALLRITSNDPRREGRVDLAYFDSGIADSISKYSWCIRRGEPYSVDLCTTLANWCADLYGRGRYRKEPDCNFTSDNYYSASLSKQEFLDKVVSKNKHILKQNKFFPKQRYIKKSEFVELEVSVQCKRTIKILVCKRHVHLIPQKLFVSNKTGKICIWPTKEKRQFRKQLTLAFYLLNKVNPYVNKQAYSRSVDASSLDYRIRDDDSCYLNSASTYLQLHHTPCGTVIEIGGNQGAYKTIWPDTQLAYRYPSGTLMPGEARKVFILLTDDCADKLLESGYPTYNGFDFTILHDDGREEALTRFAARYYGLEIENIFIPSRNSATYERALSKGVEGYARRAELENQIISEQRTSGRMFTKPRFIKRRNVYADTTTELTLNNGISIFALDCRPEHLVVGSKGRTKQEESKPLSKNELSKILSTLPAQSYKPSLREDI
jgi:hypothetical protein